MLRKSSLPIHAALLAGIALTASPVMAQSRETSPTSATNGTSETGLKDIVVTAQRREQRLQQVPMQVTAFGPETIEMAGIKTMTDALTLVPNVTFDRSFTYLNSFVTFRGISQINNADPPVAVVVDGVPQNNQKQVSQNLFDVERVEVLKGPQGGLYGRNALGGAINIVTRKPTNSFQGFIDGTYGNGDAINVIGAVSGPLIKDALLFRVSGNYEHDGGRIKNIYTGDNVDFVHHDYSLRGQLLYVGIANFKLDARADYRNFSAGGIYDSIVLSGDANDIQAPRENIQGLTFGHIANASFKADYDLGPVTLTSTSAYNRIVENYRGDLDFSNPIDLPKGFLGLGIQVGQGQNLAVTQYSQEFRLVSNGNGPLRYILGAFYLHTQRSLDTRGFVDLDSSRSQFDNPALDIIRLSEDNRNDAYAVYGQADFDITASLILSGAIRYDYDHRNQSDILTGADRQAEFGKVQPKVTLTYKLDSGRLIYATFSTGFRSGGFNAPTVSIPLFKAETLENYEAGFKTTWLNNKLRLNGAVYLEHDKNYQFFFIDASTASQIIANLDRVHVWGIEFDGQAQLTSSLEVSASLGTTNTSIRLATIFPGAVGNHTPRTTPWTANLGTQYTHPVAGDLNLVLRADYQHLSQKYWQVDNVDVQKPINLVNLRAGVEGPRWALFSFVRNLLNKKYYADYNPANFAGLPYDIGFRAQPATYGLEAKLKF